MPDKITGVFSEPAVWELDRDKMEWLKGVDNHRLAIARKIPELAKRRRLPPVRRTITIGLTFAKAISLWYLLDKRKHDQQQRLAQRLRKAAEKLGPTFIKLAQIISAGEGVFPAELVAECKKCRDQVPPVDFAAVQEVIKIELGGTSETFFTRLDPEPLAAASIAQVHKAKLANGQDVVIKVQRPDIEKVVTKDLKAMSWIAPWLIGRIKVAALANPPILVELFAATITEELDFRVEGANMLDIAASLEELNRTEFVVPRPHPKLVTKRVLVMEEMVGSPFEDRQSIIDLGLDPKEIIKGQMIGFLEGAFLHGVFHGDLHSGNLLITKEGKTALFDYGITGRLTQKQRLAFLKMLLSATSNNLVGQVESLRDLGALPKDTDIEAVISDLGLDQPQLDPTTLEPDALVDETRRLLKALLSYGAKLPKPLMLYVKNLVFIDGAIAALAPELDMFELVNDVATHFASTHAETITKQLGMTQDDWELDLTSIKSGFGVNADETDTLTYAELKERRELIRKRFAHGSKYNKKGS